MHILRLRCVQPVMSSACQHGISFFMAFS